MLITLDCAKCGATWQANVQAGSSSACRGCGKRRKVTAAMLAAGNAPGPKPRPRAAQPPDHAAGNGMRLADVSAALARLPRAHRAMARLMLRAAVARHHLRQARPDGHLGGVATGPTGAGKTLIAECVQRALGLPLAERLCGEESERSLWGRRQGKAGGATVFIPADVLSLPFAAVGELDKARGQLRETALRLLQGQALVPAEGQDVDVACTWYVSTNGPLSDVDDSYLRRCAVLNLAGYPLLPRETAEKVLAAIPRLPYEQLPPPAAELPPGALAVLRDLLKLCMTEGAAYEERGLEMAALAGAGLSGDTDLTQAAMLTAADYIEVSATAGRAVPDWQTRFERWLDGEPAGDILAETARPPASATPLSETPAAVYHERVLTMINATELGRKLTRAAEDLAGVLDDAPAAMQDHGSALVDAAAAVARDLRTAAIKQDRGRLEEAGPDALWLGPQLTDLAGQARVHAAAAWTAEHARQAAIEMDAERDRRLQIGPPRPRALPPARPADPGSYMRHGKPASREPAQQPSRRWHPHLGKAIVTQAPGKLTEADAARQRAAAEAAVMQQMADVGASAGQDSRSVAMDMMRALGIIRA